MTYQQLYLHIPFCAKRCDYCDFATGAVPTESPQIEEYSQQLIRQIRMASRAGELGALETIYIGGGTPTHIGKHLINLVYTLSLSINLHEDTEFSVECNPESLTAQLARDLYALGVNRFSIGVQSFLDNELAAVGRIHDSAQAVVAVKAAQERCANVSVDLICGLPEQTLASWLESVHTAITLDVAHISIYPLTLEDDTPLARSYDDGDLELPDEDTQATMMQKAAALLGAAGYARYEVASYAKLGYACKHNVGYWTGKSYLGLGSGAHSMRNTATGRERFSEPYDAQYCHSWSFAPRIHEDDSDFSPDKTGNKTVETLTVSQALVEDLMLGMRMAQGVSNELLQAVAATGNGALQLFDELQSLGLVIHNNGRWQPTERGWLMGNEIYGRILTLIE